MKRAFRLNFGTLVLAMLAGVVALLAGCMGQPEANAAKPMTVSFTTVAMDLASAFYARPTIGATNAASNQPIVEPVLTGTPLAANAQVMRGQYLARIGDCIGCHTRPGGAPFAGGFPLKTPFGTVISANITPDKSQGIGNVSLSQFEAALRHGIGKDGSNLYPAMPYTNYARLSNDDIVALFAYFTQAVPSAQQDNARTALVWPLSMRWLLKAWDWLYVPSTAYINDPAQSIDWNRGAYLVQGLGHCSACHTPRNALGAETASTDKEGSRFLSGALIDGWYAQPLRSNTSFSNGTNTASPGLNDWTQEDISEYLRTGRNKHTAAFGAMSDVVGHSTQYLTPQDAIAVAIYLKSLDPNEPLVVSKETPLVSTASTPHPTTLALRAGDVTQRGALLYLNNCSGCHRSDGEGAARTFPALARSSTVNATDSTSLIRIVLHGSAMPATVQAPSALTMSGFAWRLNDEDVASVLSFVRSHWGNQAVAVSSAEVAKIRAALTTTGDSK